MLAIVAAFKHWRHYLQGSEHSIEVWLDHKNLRAFMKQPRLNGRQARWLIALTPYDFTIHHRPGDFNPADGSSRRPDYMRETTVNPDLNHFLPTLTSKFAKVHSIGCNELSVPTLAKVPESCRRWRKTRVEEPQSQVRTAIRDCRADTRTIEQTAVADARGAPTPKPLPDCVSEGEETDHLLRILSVQAVTRKEARAACHGENQVILSIQAAT